MLVGLLVYFLKCFFLNFVLVIDYIVNEIDGAKIEYLAIEISNGEAVLALSSLPTMEIIVW